MAREQILKVSDTNFNISNIHVSRVKSLLNKFDTVIIHGDGAMFAGSDALTGSDYHKSFNAGYEVNKAEVISRAKFRAIYKKGDAAPTCPEDILSEFYLNANKEIQDTTKPELAKAIFQVRNNMVDAIDKASGGKYKPALNNYRDEYHIQDAFEHGHDAIIKNSKALGDRPEYFEKWVKDAKPEEVQAAKEGARIAYDTQMNAFKHAARRGTDIGDVEFNRRRLTALFGEAEADKKIPGAEVLSAPRVP